MPPNTSGVASQPSGRSRARRRAALCALGAAEGGLLNPRAGGSEGGPTTRVSLVYRPLVSNMFVHGRDKCDYLG